MLSIADVLLVIIIFGFAFAGFFFGLIHTLGSLVGTVAGFLFASTFSDKVIGWVEPVLGSSSFVKVIVFIVLFLLASRLVGFLFWLVEKAFNLLSIIPFLRSMNRLSGAVFGVLEGVIVVGAVLSYAQTRLPEWILNFGGDSRFGGYSVSVFESLFGFLPDWILNAL